MTVARDRSPELQVSPHPRTARPTQHHDPVRLVRAPLVTAATASPDYEHWALSDLRQHARDVGIPGRSTMRKHELIAALRAR